MAAGERTCSMAITEAPRTPASAPARDGTMRRCSVASGQGAVVDGLADAGQQVLAGLGHLAADDHDRRVDQVDHGGDHVADVAAGLADGGDRQGVAGPHQVDDVLAVLGGASAGADLRGEGRPGGHGLEAAGVAAAAGHVVGAGDAHVAEVAGRRRWRRAGAGRRR